MKGKNKSSCWIYTRIWNRKVTVIGAYRRTQHRLSSEDNGQLFLIFSVVIQISFLRCILDLILLVLLTNFFFFPCSGKTGPLCFFSSPSWFSQVTFLSTFDQEIKSILKHFFSSFLLFPAFVYSWFFFFILLIVIFPFPLIFHFFTVSDLKLCPALLKIL